MNERIKELADKAGFIDFIVFNRIESKEQVIEKFAQLIVQKCADIGQQYADGNYEVYNQILEHFGLEEE
jgi:uncharacterized protein YutE (UPF0331/DUF86 family)